MQKRRERIEQWRAERKKLMGETSASPSVVAAPLSPSKRWTLDDDDDDDADPNKDGGADEETEIDPLDAYMMVGVCGHDDGDDCDNDW